MAAVETSYSAAFMVRPHHDVAVGPYEAAVRQTCS
jgi:hypothetical protein